MWEEGGRGWEGEDILGGCCDVKKGDDDENDVSVVEVILPNRRTVCLRRRGNMITEPKDQRENNNKRSRFEPSVSCRLLGNKRRQAEPDVTYFIRILL